METREAFDTLLNTSASELKKIEQSGTTYFATGDFLTIL
jgi:hypothetical protein